MDLELLVLGVFLAVDGVLMRLLELWGEDSLDEEEEGVGWRSEIS